MKNYYFFIILLTSIAINAQSRCEDANYYVVSAYSHVKKAYDATNISHLQYSANRSVESMKLSIEHLKSCGCVKAIELANKAMETLAKADDVETYEDGRFFVKRGKEATRSVLDEVENCDTYTDEEVAEALVSNSDDTDALSALEREQQKLEQQQKALIAKQAALKQKLQQQESERILLARKKVITKYQNVLSTNLKTYNTSLKNCDCSSTLTDTDNAPTSDKSEDAIKAHYISALKTLASNYIFKLEACK
jgi:hypothetical protein